VEHEPGLLCETSSACCWVLRRHPCGVFLVWLLPVRPSNAPVVMGVVVVVVGWGVVVC
jgi:hypothetical protein